MEDKTPKFRLEDITFLPAGISNVIKEIIAEISQNNKLKPALAGANNLNYSCDPYCSCNAECGGHDDCNYCRCVSDCKCESYCQVEPGCGPDCDCDRHNDCNCIFYECGCHTR